VGRPRLQYLKQVARNTGAYSYTAMKRNYRNPPYWALHTYFGRCLCTSTV